MEPTAVQQLIFIVYEAQRFAEAGMNHQETTFSSTPLVLKENRCPDERFRSCSLTALTSAFGYTGCPEPAPGTAAAPPAPEVRTRMSAFCLAASALPLTADLRQG